MKWNFLLVILLSLFSLNSLASNQLIIYLSKEDMFKAMDGDIRLSYIPLGRVSYRKYFGDIEFSVSEKLVFNTLRSLIPKHSLAVVTRNKLIYKTDDNCTFAPDHINGVDISEACRNHDYCYRGLADAQSDESDQARFSKCNNGLLADIQSLCKMENKDCPFSDYYHLFVKTASYPIYKHVKYSELKMMKELFSNLKKNPQARFILENNSAFDFKMTEKKYNSFCQWIHKKKDQGRYVSKEEISICTLN
jgi:hypothetical protein